MSYFKQSKVPSVAEPPFTVDGVNLTIHATDSAGSVLPLEKEKVRTRDTVRWYKLEERTSKTSKHWRDSLADELCHKFLLLDYGGSPKVQFTLTDFPPGYHLYTHHVGTGATYDDIRKDAYLCGGGHKFRSPQEVLCHFAWLMRGKPVDQCRCIYDDKSWKRKQTPLNKAMAKEWRALQNDRVKKRFEARQRGEPYEAAPLPGSGFNEASFLRPNNGLLRMA